jgi:hypothetical protein
VSVTTTPEAQALAYAHRLDVIAAEIARGPYRPADEALEEALHAIGNLLGGLSCKGYAADLRAHLDRVEEDLLSDASPWDYSAGLGGLDPDQVFSSRLSDAIDAARADDALDWAESAQAIMDRVSAPAPVRAAIADLMEKLEDAADAS